MVRSDCFVSPRSIGYGSIVSPARVRSSSIASPYSVEWAAEPAGRRSSAAASPVRTGQVQPLGMGSNSCQWW